MCDFFSFVTEPEKHGGKRFYFDWKYRSAHFTDDNHDSHDSHSSICKHYGLDEDVCNKYEFNPLTKVFKVDQINSEIYDRLQAEDWVNKVNFKRIVKPLIIKPIVNPFHARVQELEQERRWIPMSERLPETNMFNDHFSEMVLTTNGIEFYVSSWCGEGKIWTHPYIVNLEVTHWQPLPQPPKDGE